MAVLDQTEKQKIYSKTFLTTMLVALLVFSAILISKASKLSAVTGSVSGSIGPVRLFEISKTSLPNGGYSGWFHLISDGMLVYLLFTAVIGVVLAWYRTR